MERLLATRVAHGTLALRRDALQYRLLLITLRGVFHPHVLLLTMLIVYLLVLLVLMLLHLVLLRLHLLELLYLMI